MVADIKVYMDIFQGEPELRPVEIAAIVASILERPDIKEKQERVEIEFDFRDEARRLKGDEKWLGYLFHYLIQNSLEAAGEGKGFVRVSSCVEDAPPFNVRIEIFNSGAPPTEDEEKLFTPFFSTKATGTGFGLPIARLVAKKHHGNVSIQGEGDEGTKVIVSLPHPR
jgi:signal transduction histidine kinase